MDAGAIAWAAAGAAAGFAASAVPGLHVNALSVMFLAAAPDAGSDGALFLVAALAASPFGLVLPATFLGGASDDSALQSLPAHALAAEGRALEAVALQAWGAFAGVLLAAALAFAARPMLVALAPRLPALMPLLLALVIVLLVLSEPRRLPVHARRVVVPWGLFSGRVVEGVASRDATGRLRVGRWRVEDPHGLLDGAEGVLVRVRTERRWEDGPLSGAAGRLAAAALLGLAGLLGLVALPIGARSPLGLPASPLLPLLAGLFAVPPLLDALRARRASAAATAALRAPSVPARGLLRAAAPGALASALLGIVPGVSASHAALLTPRARSPEGALLRLSAVNGGAVVFTLLAWHALGKARAGALVAAQSLSQPPRWATPLPPAPIVDEWAVVLAAAGAACLAARVCALPLARAHARLRPARVSLVGLGVLTALVAAFAGGVGLLVLAAASAVGLLAGRWRLRRGLLMGVLLVPTLAWALAAS